MNPKNSQDLFNKIRSQFTNIRLGDENGAATADSSSAVFFEFEFQEDSDTFGSVSVSIADGDTMKVFYNRNLVDKIDEDSKGEWYPDGNQMIPGLYPECIWIVPAFGCRHW